jgi:hypothetical protein
MRIQVNTLIDKRGRELAKWEGSKTPKELKKSIAQCKQMGGKVVTTWE